MSYTLPTVATVAGVFLGGVIAWFIFRSKIARAIAEMRADFQPQLATLTERVSSKEQQIASLESALDAQEDQKTQMAFELQQQCTARAAAEEKATRIPQLETEAQAREEQLALLRQEVTELKTVRSGLQTTLEKERHSAAEKLALLNEAQVRLSDAFKALAAEALKSNNQSFLT